MMAEELDNNVNRAILVFNLPDLGDLTSISSPIKTAAARTQTRLLIIIFSSIFDDISPVASWDAVQKLLTHAYIQAALVYQKHDKVLINVDVLLRAVQSSRDDAPVDQWDAVFYAGGTEGLPTPHVWSSLPAIHLPTQIPMTTGIPMDLPSSKSNPSGYPVVVLGGTFDHLHIGHKILLSMAAWIAEEKIIVGVTDDTLLVNKIHKELLESITTRIDSVRNFLRLFRPGIIYDIVPITDVYGPTGWDPNIQALVVSRETLAGADSIASFRAKKEFPPLKTFVIDVISSSSSILKTEDADTLKNAKMSSTFIRQWIHEKNITAVSK